MKFTRDHVAGRIDNWMKFLGPLSNRSVKALEVGCLEGRSTIWFLTNILTHPQSKISCYDIWPNPVIETTFDENVQESGFSSKVSKHKGDQAITLYGCAEHLDFAYIDGGKRADQFLAAAALVWPRLKSGGILIFDDYPWRWPREQVGKLPPKPGIDAFLNCWEGQYELLHKEWQVIIRKNRYTHEDVKM